MTGRSGRDGSALPTCTWIDPHTLAVGDERVSTRILQPGGAQDPLIVLKPAEMIDRYLALIEADRPRRIVELGTKEGGSAAMLALAADAEVLLTVDLEPSVPVALDRLRERAGLGSRLVTSPGTDQADRSALVAALAAAGLEGDIDLVVDDASHLLGPTRTSFEVLFPRLRPGGTYVIEDWSVDVLLAAALVGNVPPEQHGPRAAAVRTLFHRLNDPSWEPPPSIVALGAAAAGSEVGGIDGVLSSLFEVGADAPLEVLDDLGELIERPLVDLGVELMGVAMSSPDVVAEIRVDQSWIVVRRGPAALDPGTFRLADHWHDHFGYLS